MSRAVPLTPDERRASLVEATIPLLYDHGRAVTTRLIAEAAGVAEGTIFRVFDSKDELVAASLRRAFEPTRYEAELREIDPADPLEQRLLALVGALQRRFTRVLTLMDKMGMVGPSREQRRDFEERWEARLERLAEQAIGDDVARLRLGLPGTMHVLRLVTFAGSHPGISHGSPLTPQQIVDLLLLGILEKED